LKDN